MDAGDLFGGPGTTAVIAPARTAAPTPKLPADTATAGGRSQLDAAGVTRVDAPGIELYKNAHYRWCGLAAPWFGIQILLFKGQGVEALWPRMSENLRKAVMAWLPESGREIVRDACEALE